MKRFLLCLVALSAAVSTFCIAAQSPELTPEQRALIFGKPRSVTTLNKGVIRIPLEGTDHRGFYKCPYMRVYINGNGPFTFLFDTGASFTAITSKVVEEAHVQVTLERGGHHDLLRVAKIRVGEVEIEDLVALRDDDFGVDGVLGFRAFGDMNILFKLRERDLLVSEEPIPLPGSFALPIELVRNLPTVPVEIGQVQVPMLIDTGDDAYAWEVRTQDLKSATLAHPPLPVGPVINGARSQQTLISTLATTVNLGPVVIDRAVVGINDDLPVPDFGVDFLSEFNIEFEPKRMIASFQPLSPTSGTKIKGSLSPGFTLRFDDAGTVSDVVPDSPADQYGMRPGDKILAVDGRPIQAYKPRNWDEALVKGKHLKVRWLRGTNRRLDSFEVMELH